MNWQQRIKNRIRSDIPRHSAHGYALQGGLALVRNKPGLKKVGTSVAQLALPEQIVLPLMDYARRTVIAETRAGLTVKVGDRLAQGVIATVNGTVASIEPRPIIHPSHQHAPCIVIDVDHTSETTTRALPPLRTLTIDRLEQACISGLGGAGFSTSSKIRAGLAQQPGIHTLLINAMECEPMISCDEALIRSEATDIISAIHSMITLSACKVCILAIEDDKRETIGELERAIAASAAIQLADVPIRLIKLSAVYPSGAETVLIERLTGKALSAGQRASDIGILCLNVATVASAWKAMTGYPLISRIISIGGSGAVQPDNVRVRIGTPMSYVLQQTGNAPASKNIRVRAGGPLSGFDLPDLSVPITATTNCITLEPPSERAQAAPCIRCNLCSEVCPVNLIPQQLYWHSSSDDLQGAERFGLNSCIECGCCDLVCPSSIELTSTFRHTRSALYGRQYAKNEAELARHRHEQRQTRLVARKQEAHRLRERKKTQLSNSTDPIADALARARARKKSR